MVQRPIGISVLAVLAGLLGVFLLFIGLVLGAASALITPYIEPYLQQYAGLLLTTAIIEAVLIVLAAILAVFGILYLALAYGMWVGGGWAWILAIILLILDIIGGILTLPGGIVTIIIAAVILWYFMQP